MCSPNCNYFEDCSAPLCPMDPDSLENCCWYPDEEICCKHSVPVWVRRQRKIVKLSLAKDNETYYTYRMLKQNFRLQHGLVGIDPNGTDSERENDEASWMQEHPPIVPMTPEKRREFVERMSSAKSGKFPGIKKNPSVSMFRAPETPSRRG